MAHTIDALCRENATLRRQVRVTRVLLADVPHMISHGQDEVALEYVDRALSATDGWIEPEPEVRVRRESVTRSAAGSLVNRPNQQARIVYVSPAAAAMGASIPGRRS